jgi:hypothetical protein
MRNLFILLFTFLLVTCVSCEKDTYFIPGENQDPGGSEDPGPGPDLGPKTHPMLFFDSEQGTVLREAISTPDYSTMFSRIKSLAGSWGDPSPYRVETGEELYQRETGSRTSTFAMLAYLDNHSTYYFNKAKAYALRICNDYITWGNDGTPDGSEYGLSYGHNLLGLAMVYDLLYDELDDETKITVRTTLLNRARRHYAAYKNAEHNMMTNHLWINCTGLLAAGIALSLDIPDEAALWIEFTDGIFETSSKFLQPDGVSPEGMGYWQYGMNFLIPAYEMMRNYNGKDYTKNIAWWKNTGDYGSYMMIPHSRWSPTFDIIDFADSRRYSWYDSENIFRYLARLNQDPAMQWQADRISEYSQYHDWTNLLWFDPAITSSPDANKSLLKHFTDMDIVVARSNWDGDESMIVFKCGAPVGKNVHTQEATFGSSGNNVGHAHPDANHFVIFANGEYIIKNNGYVKRETKYHNTLLVSNYGQWGQAVGYWTPMLNDRLSQLHDPAITKAEKDAGGNIIIIGSAGNTYADEAVVTKFDRKFIYVPDKDAAIVYDDIVLNSAKNIELRFFPESQDGILAGNVYTVETLNNKIRIENLTPSGSTIALGMEQIEERSSSTKIPTAKLTLSKDNASALQQVTVFSWSKKTSTPFTATLNESGGKTVTIDDKTINLD